MSTREITWTKRGFLPQEAQEFTKISHSGMKAPYVRRMVSHRQAIRMNAVRYGWTLEQYDDYIVQHEYGHAIDSKGIWDYFRKFEQITPITEDYESPWRKRKSDNEKKPRVTQTRKQLLKKWIDDMNATIANPETSEKRRQQIIPIRDMRQKQLEGLA